MALMRAWPLATIFLIDVTVETCVKGRTATLDWRLTGVAETAEAATARRVTKYIVYEEIKSVGKVKV